MFHAMSLGAAFDAVLAAAAAGDGPAITTLYRDVQPRLLRYLRARAPDVCEDLAADVWVALAPQLGRFEGGETEFSGWVFSIARNKLTDHWRKAKRRQTSPHADPPETAGPGDGPEETVVGQLTVDAAVDLLARRLTPEQAEVILLRVLGGLGAKEVGDLLGMTAGAVRVAQHRALQRLAGISREAVTG